jgi:hypothetical protein
MQTASFPRQAGKQLPYLLLHNGIRRRGKSRLRMGGFGGDPSALNKQLAQESVMEHLILKFHCFVSSHN